MDNASMTHCFGPIATIDPLGNRTSQGYDTPATAYR